MAITTGPFGRLTHQILDLDYGDEQERLRYYETYAIAIHLQLVALPLVGAVVIAVAGPPATGPVLIMLGAAFAALVPGLTHMEMHSVRLESVAASKRNRNFMNVYAVSCTLLVIALVARGSDFGLGRSFGVGIGLGLALGIVAFALQSRRQSTP